MVKLCATGNDFLLINQMGNVSSPDLPSPEIIQQMCHRHEGFGADGVVVILPHAQADFQWRFFNSDGGEAEMCGNAARAVSQYVAHTQQKAELKFETKIGTIEALVENPESLSGNVTISLPTWKDFESRLSVEGKAFSYANTGVPHAVLTVSELTDLEELREWALKVKALPRFLKNGVNVTFKAQTPLADRIQSITFERGVEDFTLSCGTGAMAAAVCHAEGRKAFDLTVQVPGGMLWVSAKGNQLHLKGEGRIVGSCHFGQLDSDKEI
ncbi:MAG TPA: diaminopimelate epimerase [Bdellovibrionales bacterium]|nr:diaminopimelate epimerase [Pseudobdellovibrionaceae bacterium]HAG91224.1 diaminopimelate epimerase [Bdellovibrionales bacterium]|tara:strand:+ start:19 stop:825 length:807 start_codon:yes stop_codon:yes gene_type:complete